MKLSPIGEKSLAFGLAMAGVTRGVFAGVIIALAAWLFFDIATLTIPGIIGLVLTAMCFASFGVAVGMSIKGQEQFSIIVNFFITPMTFFCGSFFPITNLPDMVQMAVKYLPLSLANSLLRLTSWDGSAVISVAILLLTAIAGFAWSVWRLNNYSEFE